MPISNKAINVIVVAVSVMSIVAFLVGVRYFEPAPPTYSAVVEVRIYGPGWNITEMHVGVSNATAMGALEAAAAQGGFSIQKDHYEGMGDLITGVNGTSGNMTHFWLYGVNGVAGDVGADQKAVVNGDVVTWWFTDDFMSGPPGC